MSRKFLTPIGLLSKASDPSSGSVGDVYYNSSVNKIYVYNGASWGLAGAQGVQGTQGTIGTQGTTGTTASDPTVTSLMLGGM
jgi:hypothetical protein